MRVLVFNAGSSSLKWAWFADREERGTVERIAPSGFEAAARTVLDRFTNAEAIGHRIVHGGDRWVQPARITPAMLADLDALAPLAADHMPSAIALVRAAMTARPDVPNVACFDTAFHSAMPAVAHLLPIPRALGLHRYGFHGLSYTHAMKELERLGEGKGRVVLAHLGSGASLAAVHDGRCVDTTMGFTPTSGIMMGTRCGDLEPGVIFHLLRGGKSANEVEELLHRRSGLLGVSETSADMRDLLSREASDLRAHEAIDLFCLHVRKAIGAFAAVLGGLDVLVFSGGIGERSSAIRARIASPLAHLGVHIDAISNESHASRISSEASTVIVRVVPSDEESIIAEQTKRTVR